MKGKKNKKFPTKYILLIMTAFCIVIIFSSVTKEISSGPVGKVVGAVIIPMQKGLNRVGSALNLSAENLASKKELQEENSQLKEQIADLEEQLGRVSLEQYELESLRELYKLDQSYDQYDKVAANVVGKEAGNWFSTFLIDKGSDDGIEIGDNVIADGGLVGIVTDTGNNYAKIRAIIDDTSNVSATNLSTSDNCIISGSLRTMNERQQLEVSDMRDKENKAKAGDMLVTSSISDRYLPGIPIGYLTEVNEDSNKLTKSGYLATVVDFEHLEKVLVIQHTKDYSDELND